MQFWLIAGVLFEFFREIDNSDGPRHTARAEHINYTKVIESHWKAQWLQAACVAASTNFRLYSHVTHLNAAN